MAASPILAPDLLSAQDVALAPGESEPARGAESGSSSRRSASTGTAEQNAVWPPAAVSNGDKSDSAVVVLGDAEGGASFPCLRRENGNTPPAPETGANWTLRTDACPVTGWSGVHGLTGEIMWDSNCGSARCERCSRTVSARSFALARRALEELNPRHVRFVTLTLAPEDWQEVRGRMRDLAQYLRRQGIENRWLWVVERGSSTGMKHVHCVQWGDFIPWRDLLGWWGARVQIEKADAALGYLGKNVIRYLGKGIDGDRASIEAHMNLNGGRAAHWSRGFFNGLSRDGWAAAHPMPGIEWIRGELTGEPA